MAVPLTSDGTSNGSVNLILEVEREDDGRWLAEVVGLPDVLAYGQSSEEATIKAQALALRVLAEKLEHGETVSAFMNVSFVAA